MLGIAEKLMNSEKFINKNTLLMLLFEPLNIRPSKGFFSSNILINHMVISFKLKKIFSGVASNSRLRKTIIYKI